MIQPNEIKKGNWVNLDVIPYQITEIKNDCVSARYYPNKAVTLGTQYYVEETDITYNLLYPIPLTEDVLLKCGFDENMVLSTNNGELRYYGNGRMDIGGDDSCTTSMVFMSDCKYLHQLQNLFYALTNQELEIEL